MGLQQQKLVFEFKSKTVSGSTPIIPVTLKTLETWLLNLPMMNVMEAGTRLERYLHHLNLTEVPDKIRRTLLDHIKQTVSIYMDMFYKGLHGRVIDLTDERKELYQLVLSINKNMADGYMFLLQQISNKEPNFFTRKKYVDLTINSLFFLGEQLHLSYLIYAPQPKGVWQAMHVIYIYALQRDLHQIELIDEGIYLYEVTADKLYKRLLLQSMISPKSIKSAQFAQVYQGMMPWLNGIKLTLICNIDEPSGGYYINVKSDTGPVCLQTYNQDEHKLEWEIDNTTLISRLEQWVSEGGYTDPETKSTISKDLLTYLILMLKAHFIAKSKRIPSGGVVNTIIGLTQILAELKLEEHDEPKDDKTLHTVIDNQGSKTDWQQKDSTGNVWDMEYYSILDGTTDEFIEPK